MSNRQLPVFIATPFIGQGDIHNEEWIDGRIARFEGVTKNSLLHLIEEEDVHWLIFLGREPTAKVSKYAHSIFSNYENVHLLKERHDAKNINLKAAEISPVERYISMIIADDDAWPKNYITTIRKKANELLDAGYTHAGLTFANGLEWVMADQVDIHFLQKSGFNILRKQNLVEYRYPWLGCGFFILQTKERPFPFLTVAHPKIPSKLKEEGFSVHVSEEPKRAWLYNRHQLSASSLVKSESEPLNFTLEELEDEFKIDAEKINNWPQTRFSSYYSEKAQGVGMLEMYNFPDLANFVHMPFKSFFLNNGYFVINPVKDFNIRGPCRLRVYDVTLKRYMLLQKFNAECSRNLRFHRSMFDETHEYKFDVQKQVDGAWMRVMPYVLMKFKELDNPLLTEEKTPSFFDLDIPPENELKLIISSPESILSIELSPSRWNQCTLDYSLLDDSHPSKYKFLKMQVDKWIKIDEGSFDNDFGTASLL